MSVLPGGLKQWFVVALNEDLAESSDGRHVFLRAEPTRSFDTFELATWFRTRGEAIDAVDRWNLDIKALRLVSVSPNDGALVRLPVGWTAA